MSKKSSSCVALFPTIITLTASTVWADPLGTAFTYQGQLILSGDPVDGFTDMKFTVWDEAGGDPPEAQIGPTITTNGIDVVNGLFTKELDFTAAAFNGDKRWLQVEVRFPAGSGPYTTLSPRISLTGTPYALALGGLRTQSTATSPNVIGGHKDNNVTSGAGGATIAGGGVASLVNRITDAYGAIGGGDNNQAGNDAGTVSDATHATVGGGETNKALAYYSTIGGGANNQAAGWYSTIAGGVGNAANGYAAMVPGGWNCTAAGDRSFAAGRQAKANHIGTFVWADDTPADFASTAAQQFLIRASAGVGIGTTTPATGLHVRKNPTNSYGTLVLEGTDHTYMTFYPDGLASTNKAWIGFGSASDNNLSITNQVSGAHIILSPATGNVGIGTAAPTAKLHVNGNVRSDGRLDLHFGGLSRLSLETLFGEPFLFLKDASGNATIALNGSTVNGPRISIFGPGGTEDIRLDGATGTMRTKVLEITGADLAEKFPTSEEVKPGMVMEIDPDNAGQLCIARGAYNRRVAGIVSGANNFSVGAVLGNLPGSEDASPIALSGRVYCWCDASYGAIEPGDLLTTSETPGHAMKVSDYPRAQGAIIGKSMTALKSDENGLVLVLVSLQ